MARNRTNQTIRLALAGMMVAVVMVSNYISIPTAFSRLHVANAICLLSGMLFGGLQGGIIAGLGSALFDLTYPAYAAEAWITFITKGTMALVCGLIVSSNWGKAQGRRGLVLGALVGAVTYIALYLSKNYIMLRWVRAVPENTIAPMLISKLTSSLVNGLFAVIVAPILFTALLPALRRAGLVHQLPAASHVKQ
ncbi:MAG: ECF transporter S component [Clostridiales bacterium]|nr:ECF transporter S component [Clostridiales bacterium]